MMRYQVPSATHSVRPKRQRVTMLPHVCSTSTYLPCLSVLLFLISDISCPAFLPLRIV